MTPEDRSPQDRLVAQRAAIEAQIVALSDDFRGIVEASDTANVDDEHDPEGTTVAYERQLVRSRLVDAEARIEEIDRALERVRRGSYGACVQCGKPIAPARLDALPATATCIGCARL